MLAGEHSSAARRRAIARLAEMTGLSVTELTHTLREWTKETDWDIARIHTRTEAVTQLRIMPDAYRPPVGEPQGRPRVRDSRPVDPGV